MNLSQPKPHKLNPCPSFWLVKLVLTMLEPNSSLSKINYNRTSSQKLTTGSLKLCLSLWGQAQAHSTFLRKNRMATQNLAPILSNWPFPEFLYLLLRHSWLPLRMCKHGPVELSRKKLAKKNIKWDLFRQFIFAAMAASFCNWGQSNKRNIYFETQDALFNVSDNSFFAKRRII